MQALKQTAIKPKWDLILYLILLACANWGLFQNQIATHWYFYPDRVLAGQWYRVWTHAFVHVSWYHLLLDGSAFISLLVMLRQTNVCKRFLYVLGANLGCVLGVCLVLPVSNSRGYAGLSGIAHGLMAVWALECICETKDRTIRHIGWITLSIVTIKALIEASFDQVVFAFMHGSLMGHPVGISHISGIVGAVSAYALCHIKWRHGISGISTTNPIQSVSN